MERSCGGCGAASTDQSASVAADMQRLGSIESRFVGCHGRKRRQHADNRLLTPFTAKRKDLRRYMLGLRWWTVKIFIYASGFYFILRGINATSALSGYGPLSNKAYARRMNIVIWE
jgi:hypothetical protein